MLQRPEGQPLVRIAFIFHDDIEFLSLTLPTALEALVGGTSVPYDVVVVADAAEHETAVRLLTLADEWGIDEVRVRSREHHSVTGAPSNNAHPRLFGRDVPYLIVLEDDVLAFRTDPDFDVLKEMVASFEEDNKLTALFTIRDHAEWAWPLVRVGRTKGGYSAINRVSAHCIMYDAKRFADVAAAFGAFNGDHFVDRDDFDYNWEDVVSHIGTTSDRTIGYVEDWPLDIYHCDLKGTIGSMYNTQNPYIRRFIANSLLRSYGKHGRFP